MAGPYGPAEMRDGLKANVANPESTAIVVEATLAFREPGRRCASTLRSDPAWGVVGSSCGHGGGMLALGGGRGERLSRRFRGFRRWTRRQKNPLPTRSRAVADSARCSRAVADSARFPRRTRRGKKGGGLNLAQRGLLDEGLARCRAAAGFDAHVAKPVEPAALVATVARLVGREAGG